jgi:uncharacterized membrane protein
VLLLVAVFPANIYVALNNVQLGGVMSAPIYQWLRLPMQLVLISMVVGCGGLYPLARQEHLEKMKNEG